MSEQKIIAIDSTELDNFAMCNFRWDAFHHRHLRPKQTESFFESGTLLHYLCERYYLQKRDNVDGIPDIEQIIEEGRVKSLEFNTNLDEVSEIIFQFREYTRYYKDENIIPLHVEEPFMVKIFEDESLLLYITGQPDLIFKYANTNNIGVMDHKKVSRDSPISPLRNQFMLYATAIGTDTVIVNKIGFQKTKKSHERFLRTPYIYSPELLAEWKEEAVGYARQMVLAEQFQHYPRNRTSCEKWAGCYLQRFCSTRPSAREFLIGTEYLIGESWDVSGKLEGLKGIH